MVNSIAYAVNTTGMALRAALRARGRAVRAAAGSGQSIYCMRPARLPHQNIYSIGIQSIYFWIKL